MPTTPDITLTGGLFQDLEGSPLDLGYLIIELSHDEQVPILPAQVVAGLKKKILLNASGSIPASPATLVWSNASMLPSNSFYTVMAYKADGTQAWADFQYWVILASPTTLDVGSIVPTNPPGSGSGSGSTTLLLETNGTVNSNQSLLNLANGTNVTITNVSGTTTINAQGGANFSTPGQGFFYGFQDVLPIGDGGGTGSYMVFTNNAVGVAQLNLDFQITISNISVFMATATGSGAVFYAAIYNAAGTVKLVDATGGFDTTTGSQTVKNVAITPVTLQPGSYLFACGNTSVTGGSVVGHGPYNNYFINSLLNANNTRVASSSNVISGGAMPATLGTLTPFTHADNQLSLPAVMFQV